MFSLRPFMRLLVPCLLLVVVIALSACFRVENQPRVWIDYPRDGFTLPSNTPLEILAHAYARRGVDEVVLLVNGVEIQRDHPSGEETITFKMKQSWNPPEAGSYAIELIAYDTAGNSSPPAVVQVEVKDIKPQQQVGSIDIALEKVEPFVSEYKGEYPICQLVVVARNRGSEVTDKDLTAQLFYNGALSQSRVIAAGLQPQSEVMVDFNFTFTEKATIRVVLDAADVIAEVDENNNTDEKLVECVGQAQMGAVLASPSVTPTIEPSVTPTLQIICPPQAVALQDAKCRTGPSKAYDVVGGLSSGNAATVIGRNSNNTWYLIKGASDRSCWISASLISLSTENCNIPLAPVPPLPTTPAPQAEEPEGESQQPSSEDTTPPPVPQPAVPANGSSLNCRQSQNLVWIPVADASGIAGYEIEIEVLVKKRWQSAASFGPVSGKQITINVECGSKYRWRVRAQDGVGNYSDWSAWSSFNVQLP